MTQAIMDTTKGKIIIELFSQETPKTVANFVKLSEDGFYNNLKFHRVISNFMVQGGCPKGTGTGGPGYQIGCEIRPNLKHETGSMSMAHAGSCDHNSSTGAKVSGSCSNGSQFFITHQPTPHLDGVHTVFGRVIQGQDVVNAIRQGDAINTITIQK
jgi:peptidyl-prolyl cis-trans isomerase B (cyclophilin B)